MLGETTILTQNQDATSRRTLAATSNSDAVPHGLPSEELAQLLSLHAKEPQRWDARALAERFGVRNEAALSGALLHLQDGPIRPLTDGWTVAA